MYSCIIACSITKFVKSERFRRIISDQNKVRSFTSPDFKYDEADILVVNNASNGFTKDVFFF